MASLPDPSEVVGYIVLTAQPDGTWQPDWDGLLHLDPDTAANELRAAGSEDFAILVECVRVTD